MIVITFIAMIYCLLVYVVGADSPVLWKLVLLLLTAFSLIWQFSKGMSSGLTPIESLGDHGLDEVIEGAKNLKNTLLGSEQE